MGRIKRRTDSMHSQILNHRPHWDFLRSVTPPPLRVMEVTGHSHRSAFKWQNIPPSPKQHNGAAAYDQQFIKFPKFDINLNSPNADDLRGDIPAISEIPTPGPASLDPRPDSRPSYILLNGGPAYRSGLAGPTKFTPESPYRTITPPSASTWTKNQIFSPKVKPKSPIIVKCLNNELKYSPCVLDQESYINRLSNIEFTPTLGRVVDNIYNTICDYSDIEHPCCPPKPENKNPESNKIPYQSCNQLSDPENIADGEGEGEGEGDFPSPATGVITNTTSSFSVLSTPFSYDEYQPNFTDEPSRYLTGLEVDYGYPGDDGYLNLRDLLAPRDLVLSGQGEELEVRLDDFIQTPGANTLCSPSQVTVFPANKASVRSSGNDVISMARPRTLSIKTLESYFRHVQPFRFSSSRNSSMKVNVDSSYSPKQPKSKQLFSPVDSILSFFCRSSPKVFSPILSTSPSTTKPPPGTLPSPKVYPENINYRAIPLKQNQLLTSLIEHDVNRNNVRKTGKFAKCKKILSPFLVSPVKSPFKIFSRNASPKNTTSDEYNPLKVGKDGMSRPDIHSNGPTYQSSPYPLDNHLYSNITTTNQRNRPPLLNGHTPGLDPSRVINVDRSYIRTPTMVASSQAGRELYQVSLQDRQLSPEDRQLHKLSILDEGLFWEGFDGPRGTPEGDEVLKVISNCEPTDILLPTLLKDNVVKVERRLLFYFKQLKNVKYCYDIVEKIAIQDAHGITLLVQLLNTTESFEIQELVTGVFWNLSSSDTLKIPILKQALEPLVKNIIIPLSGWKETQGIPFDQIGYNANISWTTVFRNATGCLKNLSSAGLEGRTLLRLCHGLVDSLLWTVRSAQGKNDVDNKAVENAVCILRNLSYRLEAEVAPEVKYGAGDDWRSRGLGGGQFRRKTPEEGKKKKKGKGREVNVTPLPDHTAGVGLLWQSGVVRVYLDLLLECSNPETLEGAAGALQNLTACSWEPAQAIRETVRKEKGLSVITSLLRLPNDLVVRATAFCLRNLAIDHKNKELLGKHATLDLVKRLPGGDGMDGITDITITGVVSAVSEIVADSQDNARIFRDYDGVGRLMIIARSQDIYNRQCVFTSNKILAALWEVKDIKRQLKSMGWNISFYTRLQTLDRSNDGMAGMEYDETRNQFRISGSDKPALPDHCVKSPDPTFDSHTMGRNHGTPDMLSPALTTITSSPSNHVTSPNSHVPSLHQYQMTSSQRHVSSSPAHSAEYESPLQNRSSTLGRNNNSVLPHKSYQNYPQQEPPELPQRGHSTLPSRNYQSNRYTVADSWV